MLLLYSNSGALFQVIMLVIQEIIVDVECRNVFFLSF